jgi:ribokinase
VVGSVNLDLVATSPRVPAPGETITGQEFCTFNGGKGANQAVGVARLGYPVSMIGKVGDDAFGAQLKRALREPGVDVRAVATAKGSSGVALIKSVRTARTASWWCLAPTATCARPISAKTLRCSGAPG